METEIIQSSQKGEGVVEPMMVRPKPAILRGGIRPCYGKK